MSCFSFSLCDTIYFHLTKFQGIKLPAYWKNPRVMNSPGQLYLFDFYSPEDGAQVVSCNSFPDYGTKHFGPHGLSVLKDKDMKFNA